MIKFYYQNTITNKINPQPQHIIQTHYKKDKLNNTIDQFEEISYINEAITKIAILLKIFLLENCCY